MDWLKIILFYIAIICSTLFVPALLRYFILRYRLRNFKGPKGLPFLGNVLQSGKKNAPYFKFMCNLAEEFRENGSFLRYLGLSPFITVYNADDMERVLCSMKHDDKGFFYTSFASPWLGDGLLLSKGHKWASRRKLLTPSFHFSILKKFLVVFNEQAELLTTKLCGLSDQPSVNLPPLLSLCTLDIMCETIMGFRLGAQKGEGSTYVDAVHSMGKTLTHRFRKPWYWSDFIFRRTQLGKEHDKCLKILHDTTKKVINDRKFEKQKEGLKDVVIDDESQKVRERRRLAFLDLLIEIQRQDPSFTDNDIQEEVDTFMFEGHDTVSTSLIMALFLIGRHPDVQKKIQEEFNHVFGNDRERFVASDDLPKLEYLSCVMKESQRLLTTVPNVNRDLGEDTIIGGITVPKGTHLSLGFFFLHRDPKHFPNPEKFDPDRFLPANCNGRHNFAFIPFSAGHRNCIGQRFAIMEQKVILATLLRKIEVTSLQTIDELQLAAEGILRALNGVHVNLVLRR
ncbi:Cytochrome P450 4V2 [Holothuria leucospilota]|uniref:Cytochrome P450 4V2 n=1 Tax=Holothuria leucospilota TaxID=206669 RepID=A0A9Q0YRK1_HOLLE|nr:Cytochrome P450 4V2 [Holothuria leucospilota]